MNPRNTNENRVTHFLSSTWAFIFKPSKGNWNEKSPKHNQCLSTSSLYPLPINYPQFRKRYIHKNKCFLVIPSFNDWDQETRGKKWKNTVFLALEIDTLVWLKHSGDPHVWRGDQVAYKWIPRSVCISMTISMFISVSITSLSIFQVRDYNRLNKNNTSYTYLILNNIKNNRKPWKSTQISFVCVCV